MRIVETHTTVDEISNIPDHRLTNSADALVETSIENGYEIAHEQIVVQSNKMIRVIRWEKEVVLQDEEDTDEE